MNETVNTPELNVPELNVPEEDVLWTAEEIATYIHGSPRVVAEKYAPRPDFPAAVRPGGKTGHKRWYRTEVIAWVRAQREKKVKV